ncbi:Uncharacterised protein [Vibrio cholerae]|nr:Uncharacterised protein [Vibrio cholerae]
MQNLRSLKTAQRLKLRHRPTLAIDNRLIKHFDIAICYPFLHPFFQCFTTLNLLMDCAIIKVDMSSFPRVVLQHGLDGMGNEALYFVGIHI